MTDEELEALGKMPAPLRFTHMVFRLFTERAKPEQVAIPLTNDTQDELVFRGKIGSLLDEVGASKAYYSKIRRILIDSGSIVILERGGQHSPSLVVVRPDSPPPNEMPANVKSSTQPLTDRPALDRLGHRVEAIENRLGGVNLTEMVRNFEGRIARLEQGAPDENGKNVGES